MRTSDLASPSGPEAGEPSTQYSAPLGAAAAGRLIFASGAANATLRAGPALGDLLYRAHFARHLPCVRAQAGIVTIQYRSIPVLDWLAYARREPVAQVELNPTIPWELEFRGGVSKLDADLRVEEPAIDEGLAGESDREERLDDVDERASRSAAADVRRRERRSK